jgi:hypothetical protein
VFSQPLRYAIAAAAVLFSAACGRSNRRSAAASATPVALATEHFTLTSSAAIDSTTLRAMLVFLEQHRNRVINDLEATTVGTIHIEIQSKPIFDSTWKKLIDSVGLGFQPQGLTGSDGTIYIYGPWAESHTGKPLGTVALHEFAHAVTKRSAVEHVAASGRDTLAFLASLGAIGQRTRWLSEAIALYEAGQSTDLNHFGYLIRGKYPSIETLNDPANSQIYDIGYRLAEYVVNTWGRDALVRLVNDDGNVQAALGVTPDVLMRGWFLHIEDRYLLIKPRWFTRGM